MLQIAENSDIVNSTTTDGCIPPLDVDISSIPVLDVDSSNIPVLENSTAVPFQPDIYDEPPILQNMCLDIPVPAELGSHEFAMNELLDMTGRSDQDIYVTYE